MRGQYLITKNKALVEIPGFFYFMDKEKLREERIELLKRLRLIEKQLSIKPTMLGLDEIRDKVNEFTGINVENIGTKGNMKTKIAKQLFWRVAFNHSYSGTLLSEYCGMKSRFSAINGRYLHIEKCKKDKSVLFDWNRFKETL